METAAIVKQPDSTPAVLAAWWSRQTRPFAPARSRPSAPRPAKTIGQPKLAPASAPIGAPKESDTSRPDTTIASQVARRLDERCHLPAHRWTATLRLPRPRPIISRQAARSNCRPPPSADWRRQKRKGSKSAFAHAQSCRRYDRGSARLACRLGKKWSHLTRPKRREFRNRPRSEGATEKQQTDRSRLRTW